MRFFNYFLPVDPSRIQFNFETTLRRHNISASPNALEALFSKLKVMGSPDGGNLDSPFPLVRSVAAAHNHAKKLQAALGGKDGPKLGKCQQVLSDFYGFRKWDFFKTALMEFSKIQMAETQAASGVRQSMSAAGLPQETAPTKSGLTTADVEKKDPPVTEKVAETVIEAKPAPQFGSKEVAMVVAEEQADRLLAMEEATLIAAEEEADRQWAMEEAALIAAEEEADRQWAMEEAALIAAEEEADRQWAMEEAALIAAEEEADRQWAMEEAAQIAAEEEADRQWTMEEAALVAAEDEADRQWAMNEAYLSEAEEDDDNEDIGEDDIFIGRDWVDELDPNMQDFADQFGSKEEFEEYMDNI